MHTLPLRFFIDRGGTFTDVVALAGDGRVIVAKMLSQGSHYKKDPAVLAIEKIVAAEKASGGPEMQINIEEVRLGTTVATNALLERQGEPAVLVTNKGFGDALIIGYQNRPDIFALNIDRSPPLFHHVIELDCRFDKEGRELVSFPCQTARQELQEAIVGLGIKSVAIVFMHGYKYPAHEIACGDIAAQLGYEQISLSHKTNGLIRYISRGDTTLLDAYLTPPLRRYLDEVSRDLPDTNMLFMKSDGGLARKEVFSGKDAILSGPAGGVVGAVAIARAHRSAGGTFKEEKYTGEEPISIVGFDMGGTSTDVSYYQSHYERQMESTVSGVRLRAPMLAVHTVAAGGGSILKFDGSRFLVGPHSAKAVPGPACYGLGGPATVTDANLILGRLSRADFPSVFGQSGQEPLDINASKERLLAVKQQLEQSTSAATADSYKAGGYKTQSYKTVEEIAEGFLTVAGEKMAQAVAKVSIQKGHDVRSATLVAFGGAGGQHACLIAQRLGIKTVLLSPMAGVLSAYGIGASETTDIKQLTVRLPLSQVTLDGLSQGFDDLCLETIKALSVEKDDDRLLTSFQLGLSYKGSDTTILVDYAPAVDGVPQVSDRFKVEHKKIFGFVYDKETLIVESILCESRIKARAISQNLAAPEPGTVVSRRAGGQPWQIFSGGEWQQALLYRREELIAGMIIEGPALVTEPISTNVIESGWQACVLEDGCLLVTTRPVGTDGEHVDITAAVAASCLQQVDPVQLELFNNIFMSIAEEMGITLQKVSHSVNIKERLDFSCAVFDQAGRLIANAPHIPVHLGSMGDSVVSLIKAHKDSLKPGDAYVLNNPYNGGTHLPDLTVISPVFAQASPNSADAAELLFFVASRGHHADIGGITPGSMPPGSCNIEEEGVLIDNFKVLDGGRFLQQEFVDLLTGVKYPVRNVEQNIKDLKAQIAANNRGQEGLYKAIKRHGLTTVRTYMDHVRDNASKSIKDILKQLQSGQAACTMDDGSTIVVKVLVDQVNCTAIIDFTGTTKETKNNLNTPLAVTRAAVLYVFRTLSHADIPLNDGCSEPLTLIVPEGSLLNPTYPSAVVAGNVETSQVIVDTLYQALGVLAGSQGTMNNFTFGDAEHQYYETIAGGSGAGNGFHGTDAVQTHMTNSRLTDPEILEERFPVLLEEFSIRKNSGGAGKFHGGCGAVRKIRFLRPMSASILSNRRTTQAPGLNGGGAGLPGSNYLIDHDGSKIILASTATTDVQAGQSIVIETPGGGGYG